MLYQEILISLQYLPKQWDQSHVLVGLASVTRSLGQIERAAHLLAAANGIALTFQCNALDIPNFEHEVASVRYQLGATAFVEAWAAVSRN